jgi:hypothetical protein
LLNADALYTKGILSVMTNRRQIADRHKFTLTNAVLSRKL